MAHVPSHLALPSAHSSTSSHFLPSLARRRPERQVQRALPSWDVQPSSQPPLPAPHWSVGKQPPPDVEPPYRLNPGSHSHR